MRNVPIAMRNVPIAMRNVLIALLLCCCDTKRVLLLRCNMRACLDGVRVHVAVQGTRLLFQCMSAYERCRGLAWDMARVASIRSSLFAIGLPGTCEEEGREGGREGERERERERERDRKSVV